MIKNTATEEARSNAIAKKTTVGLGKRQAFDVHAEHACQR
jgi:hypothetical protein